jgi:hypothetical protein
VVWAVGVLAAMHLLPGRSCGDGGACAGQNWAMAQRLAGGPPRLRAAALDASFRNPNASATAIILAARPGHPLTSADDAAIQAVEQVVGKVPGVLAVGAGSRGAAPLTATRCRP